MRSGRGRPWHNNEECLVGCERIRCTTPPNFKGKEYRSWSLALWRGFRIWLKMCSTCTRSRQDSRNEERTREILYIQVSICQITSDLRELSCRWLGNWANVIPSINHPQQIQPHGGCRIQESCHKSNKKTQVWKWLYGLQLISGVNVIQCFSQWFSVLSPIWNLLIW